MNTPDESGPTLPPGDLDTTDERPIVIPAGEAQVVLSAALDDLVRAFKRVEAVSMACARALDAQAAKP